MLRNYDTFTIYHVISAISIRLINIIWALIQNQKQTNEVDNQNWSYFNMIIDLSQRIVTPLSSRRSWFLTTLHSELQGQLYTLYSELQGQLFTPRAVTQMTPFWSFPPGGIPRLTCVIWPISELFITCQLKWDCLYHFLLYAFIGCIC